MQIIDANDGNYKEITFAWTAVHVPFYMAQRRRINWLLERPRRKRIFFVRESDVFWFEDEKDALLFRIAWGN